MLFKIVKNKIIVDSPVMKIYIPEIYIERSIAEFRSDFVRTLGIFYFSVGKTEEKEDKFHLLKLPSEIKIKYSVIEKLTIPDIDTGLENKYHVITLFKGDVFMESAEVEESDDSALKFILFLFSGKIPSKLGYKNIIDAYNKSLEINNVDLGVPPMALECIVSELCRSRKDTSIPFRRIIGKDTFKGTERDFKAVNIKEIPFLASTFSSISFENINKGLTFAVERDFSNKKDQRSPVENTIKY